jgi:hypothetical protein
MADDDGGEAPVLFPAYVEKVFKDRTLAYFEAGVIITETGESYLCESLRDLLDCVFEHNLLTFLLSMPSFPWLADVIAYDHKVHEGRPVGLSLLRAGGVRSCLLSGSKPCGACMRRCVWARKPRRGD